MHAATLSRILASAPVVPDAHRIFLFDGQESSVQALRVWPPRVASFDLARGRWLPSLISASGAVLAKPYEPDIGGDELDWWSVDVRPLFLQIPTCVRGVLARLPRLYAWKVLCLVANAPPAARALVRPPPVLAGLLAFAGRTLYADEPFHEQVLRQDFVGLLGKPRRRLLPLLGLADARWIIRVLSKMDVRVLIEPGLDALLELFTRAETDTKWRRRLQHLERLPADVTEVLADQTLFPMAAFGLMSDESRPAAVHLAACLEALRDAGSTRRFSSWATLEKALLPLPAEHRPLRGEQWDPTDYPGEFETPTGEVISRRTRR